MPELPEVETIRRGLQKKLIGKRIERVEIRHAKTARGEARRLQIALAGKQFSKIGRRGKLLIFHLHPKGGNGYMLVHLKMTGQLIYEDKKRVAGGGHTFQAGQAWPNSHTRAIIHFSDQSKLYFNDQRLFGFMKIVDGKELEAIQDAYGPEPFSKQFTWEYFREGMKRRQTSLKAVLLDQKFVAGLGNIYADEVAWRARVKPQRRASSLTEEERKRVYAAIPKILREAIAAGGTTFSHFRDAGGRMGNYVRKLRVHGRAGKACKRCKVILKKTRVAQRGTVYCPQCQI